MVPGNALFPTMTKIRPVKGSTPPTRKTAPRLLRFALNGEATENGKGVPHDVVVGILKHHGFSTPGTRKRVIRGGTRLTTGAVQFLSPSSG